MGKTKGIILSIIMIIIGILLISFGFSHFLGVADNLNQPPAIFKGALIGGILIFIGGLLIFGGLIILYLTNMGKIFFYVTKETSQGTERISKSVARGIKKGLKGK